VKSFVTGATGFVGSHLVEALLARGDHVTCLVRSQAKADRLFPTDRPEFVSGDLSDRAALRRACADADLVFHLAGLTAARYRAEFLAVNEGGTRAVIDAVREAAPGIRRFLYVSSLAAAGPTARGRPLTEEDLPRPVSAYGASKLAGEAAAKTSGLPWTVVRPPAVYGPRDVELLRVFKLARLGVRVVLGDGNQELSFIHVTDLVSALLRVTVEGADGATYFACHPETVTSREFVGEVHRAVRHSAGKQQPASGQPLTVAVPAWIARPVLATSGALAKIVGRRTLLSADKANELLAEAWTCSPAAIERDTGWSATIPLATGLEDTATWYRQHGWL
jgi:nucleoside-diphosphate-sugar epimerase